MDPSLQPSLDLEELRALRGKARGRTATVRPPGEAAPVDRFDPRQTGRFSALQKQGLEGLHQACAVQLGGALGTLLHAGCEASLRSAEQIPCAEFLARLPQPAYLAALATALDVRVLLQIDLPLLLPMLDMLLGGAGKEAVEARELTEIEAEILEPVGRTVCRQLDQAWQPLLKMDFAWDGLLALGQTATVFLPGDRLLVLTFEVRLQDAKGALQLAFPSVISGALLRKLTPPEPAPKPRPAQNRDSLREQLLEGRFEADLRLPNSAVSLRRLRELRTGDVLVLSVGANEPVEVQVAGRSMFLGTPARRGLHRGAQVQQVLSIVPQEEGEERK